MEEGISLGSGCSPSVVLVPDGVKDRPSPSLELPPPEIHATTLPYNHVKGAESVAGDRPSRGEPVVHSTNFGDEGEDSSLSHEYARSKIDAHKEQNTISSKNARLHSTRMHLAVPRNPYVPLRYSHSQSAKHCYLPVCGWCCSHS